MTGQLLAHFPGHRDGVLAVAWVPGGCRVLSAGCDHQVLVWDTSLRALAGKADPLPPAERRAAWDQLGTRRANDAIKAMAALAADPEGSVAVITAELRPAAAPAASTLDRIFRDLDDADFAVRDKASRELSALKVGAVAGVRERLAAVMSAEVRQRAGEFLRRFDGGALTPDRVRVSRALDVLVAADTPAARKLVADLAGGARGVWLTETARQAHRVMNAGR